MTPRDGSPLVRWATLALVLGGALLPACRFKGEDARQRRERFGGWPLRPTAMRIHPFTAMTVEDGRFMLDVRIELLDPAGDVTKGIGDFRFELYAQGPRESQAGQERRHYQWHASVADLESNRERWDPITRTYQFQLHLDPPPPDRPRLELRVQFDAPTGERLTAETTVEKPRRPVRSPPPDGA